MKMDRSSPKFQLCSILLSLLFVCSSGSKQLLESIQTTQHTAVTMEPPITTNPVTARSATTAPAFLPTPQLITVPSPDPLTAPLTFSPLTQIPVSSTPPVAVTNPVTTPSATIPGGQQPAVNPANPYPGTASWTGGGGGATGQSWCVARPGAAEAAVQAALDYACGMGSADCSAIQEGGSCFSPDSLQNHASFAFNSYYQRNPIPTSCDFGGSAMITNVNPSSGSCLYTIGQAASLVPPTTMNPVTTTPMPTPTTSMPAPMIPIPTPTTEPLSGATPTTSSVIPPALFNTSGPTLGGGVGGYGESPTTANLSSGFRRGKFQRLVRCAAVAAFIITGAAVDV